MFVFNVSYFCINFKGLKADSRSPLIYMTFIFNWRDKELSRILIPVNLTSINLLLTLCQRYPIFK